VAEGGAGEVKKIIILVVCGDDSFCGIFTQFSRFRAMEELERQMREEEEKKRRPSRFEVTPAPDILKLKTQSTNELMPSVDGVISFFSQK
jgi:hypothetical protein